jgi:hypothetical protein
MCDGYVPYRGDYIVPNYPCWGDFAEYCAQSDTAEVPVEAPDSPVEESPQDTTFDQDADDGQDPPQVFDDRILNDDAALCPPLDDCGPPARAAR